jgi:hypothetical protein
MRAGTRLTFGIAILSGVAACTEPRGAGSYEMRSVGPGPVPGQVFALGMNDSGVVVGYIFNGTGRPHPFRWKAGVFEMLADGGSFVAVPVAINNDGDVLGDLPGGVLWASGSTIAAPVLTSAGAAVRPVDINDNGDILAKVGSTPVVLKAGTREPWGTFSNLFEPAFLLDNGWVVGIWINALHPPVHLIHPDGRQCGLNRYDTGLAASPGGFILYHSSAAQGSASYSLWLATRIGSTCPNEFGTTVFDDRLVSFPVELTAINDSGVVAGTYGEKAILRSVALDQTDELDVLLGNGVHVLEVRALSNSGAVLARVDSAGSLRWALLSPRR